MSDEQARKDLPGLVKRLSDLLAPLMYPPRPDGPVVAPFGVVKACGHVEISDPRSWTTADTLGAEYADPGVPCWWCGDRRRFMKQVVPLHWRMN